MNHEGTSQKNNAQRTREVGCNIINTLPRYEAYKSKESKQHGAGFIRIAYAYSILA